MKKVQMRITKKTGDKEVSEFVAVAINPDHVSVVTPSALEDVVVLTMTNSNNHLVKGSVEDWYK